jgi:hypothetical protein
MSTRPVPALLLCDTASPNKRAGTVRSNGGERCRIQGESMRAMRLRRLMMGYSANVEIIMGSIQERLGGLASRLHDRWILCACLLRWHAKIREFILATSARGLEAQWHNCSIRASRNQAVAISFMQQLLNERHHCIRARVLGAWCRGSKRTKLKTVAVSNLRRFLFHRSPPAAPSPPLSLSPAPAHTMRRTSSFRLKLQASREAEVVIECVLFNRRCSLLTVSREEEMKGLYLLGGFHSLMIYREQSL